jgi:hypothetical protein
LGSTATLVGEKGMFIEILAVLRRLESNSVAETAGWVKTTKRLPLLFTAAQHRIAGSE